MKIGSATCRDGTVTACLETEVATHRWSYSAPELTADRASDALLVASLLPAMRAGEPLVSSEPVSARLLASMATVEDVFRSFRQRIPGYDAYQRVPVEAATRPAHPLPRGRGKASFFTAGVDSFYTALRHRAELDALVYVRGFDVALDDPALDALVVAGVQSAAAELGLPLIVVRTDLRSFSDRYSNWLHYHGAALASVAHLLAACFSTVYVPGSQSYAYLSPLGSHPLLDPLWSSEDMELVHDGCEASRLDKLEMIAREPAAKRWLRVCWTNRRGEYNCGRCEKCLRTMVGLRALGLLDEFERIPHRISTFDVARVQIPDFPYSWEASSALLDSNGRDPVVARAVRRRLYGPSTRALHRAVYYAHRVRALARR